MPQMMIIVIQYDYLAKCGLLLHKLKISIYISESGDTFNINTITFQANQDTAMATVVVDDGNCELSENFTVSIMSSNPSVITSSLIREYSIADNDGEYCAMKLHIIA